EWLERALTGVKEISPLGTLKKLTRVNLDYTAVTDQGLEFLKGLPQLRDLRLDSTAVTDASADTLAGMSSLRPLNLYHTVWSEPAYQRLQKALPDCRIIWDRSSAMPNRRGS